MSRPNVLFLFTDEQRYDTLSAYGNEQITMPHLNRLAGGSTVFDRAYVTQPVCTPSRSSLMTGLYPHTNGCTENNFLLDEQIPCLPEMFPAGEYATAYMGKWHLGDEIFAQHGYEEWISIEDFYSSYYREGRDENAKSSYWHFLNRNGFEPDVGEDYTRKFACRVPEPFSKPAFLADEAIRYIQQHRHHPFCLTINFLEPHMPFTSVRDDQYDPNTIPLPENWDDSPLENQPLKTRLFAHVYRQNGYSEQPLDTDDHWRSLISRYWGLCSLVDTHVGRILTALDEEGLVDNTIIVFTSDHGDMMGSHRLLAKCVMFEEAIRVPMIIHMPGQNTTRHVSRPVSQIDLVPTLLDGMGISPPSSLEGQSLLPLLEGREGPSSEVVIEWNGGNTGMGEKVGGVKVNPSMLDITDTASAERAILDPVRCLQTEDGWKYTCSPSGEHELYNLNDDPWERRNLAFEDESRTIIRQMEKRLVSWQKKTDDAVNLR